MPPKSAVSGTADHLGRQRDLSPLAGVTVHPVGITHRLENAGEMLLDIIEVQTGDYLGEDAIVRYEDRYGRGEAE